MPAVYIMSNPSHTVLYTGVTNNLERRVQAHKMREGSVFARTYNCIELVYFEETKSMIAAIEEEKRIKGGSRKKKIELIESMNPNWDDLAKDWNI